MGKHDFLRQSFTSVRCFCFIGSLWFRKFKSLPKQLCTLYTAPFMKHTMLFIKRQDPYVQERLFSGCMACGIHCIPKMNKGNLNFFNESELCYRCLFGWLVKDKAKLLKYPTGCIWIKLDPIYQSRSVKPTNTAVWEAKSQINLLDHSRSVSAST